MKSKICEIYSLEELSSNPTCIQKLHPFVKFFSALVVIITTISFHRYDLTGLIPMILYPAFLMSLGEIPFSLLIKRSAIALPFCIFAGISNLFFDKSIAFFFFSMPISFGALSFITLIFKTILCVTVVLILVATTPFYELTATLRAFHVPEIFVTMFEITYRYIGTLVEEASSQSCAYHLRSPKQKGIQMQHMGSFVGGLLLRSFDRAGRVYSAMKCRGYALKTLAYQKRRITYNDILFLFIILSSCILFRIFHVQNLLNALLSGVFS